MITKEENVMPIILISSDSQSTGAEIAQVTAENLGYELLDQELIETVADKHQIPKDKLLQVLTEQPSFFGISSREWNRYLAYIQEATLSELIGDKIVCVGLAAHLYVLGVSHVLKIRILANPEDIKQEIATEKGVSQVKAGKLLDERRKRSRRWSMDTYGIDETDPSQYDLVISLSQIDSDEAVKIISETVTSRRFSPMTYSKKRISDIELASRVRAALIDQVPDVRVRADSGMIVVNTTALKRGKKKKSDLIKDIAGNIPGVEYVEVHVINDFFRQAAESQS
jgi:cytidylate kinase